jgi:hypothetical protein
MTRIICVCHVISTAEKELASQRWGSSCREAYSNSVRLEIDWLSWNSTYITVFTISSVALSPRANYTDWATATCWRNLVPTFADRGVSRGQRGRPPTVVNLSFLDRIRYFSFKYLLIYPHKGWVDPVPDPLLLRKSCSAGNQTRDLRVSRQVLWSLDNRGGLPCSK